MPWPDVTGIVCGLTDPNMEVLAGRVAYVRLRMLAGTGGCFMGGGHFPAHCGTHRGGWNGLILPCNTSNKTEEQ